MSIFQQISAILSSVQSGTPLTASQYETLAKSSEAETKQAVGANAPIIEDAYNSYMQNVVLADNQPLVLCSDGEGNEWYEKK